MSRRIEQYRVGQATGIGMLAFPVGYVFTTLVVAVGGSIDTSKPLEAARLIGYVFYNAHNIPVRQYGKQAAVVEGGPTELRSFSDVANIIQQSSTSIPEVVFYLVPVVVLLAAGVLLAVRYLDDDLGTARQAGLVGGLALGYLLAMLAASFLVAESNANGPAWVAVNPERLRTLVAGIGYPLVLGTISTSAVAILRRVRR